MSKLYFQPKFAKSAALLSCCWRFFVILVKTTVLRSERYFKPNFVENNTFQLVSAF